MSSSTTTMSNALTMSGTKRYAFIDIAKGIGILMIIFAHINVEGLLYQSLYSFHIPLFFIIAGMTFNGDKQSFRKFIHKKTMRLLLPYLVYSLVTFAWYALVEVKMPEFNHSKLQTTTGSFFEIFLCRGSVNFLQHNPALWFIPCLFLTEVLYYALCKCKNKIIRVSLGLLLGVLGYVFTLDFMPEIFRELPWQAGVSFVAIPFVMLGHSVSKAKSLDEIEKIFTSKKLLSWALVIAGAAAVVALTMLNGLFLPVEAKGHVSMGSKELGNIGIFYINAVIGSSLIIILSVLLADIFKERIELHKSGLVWLGQHSFALMAVHFPVKRRIVVLVGQAIEAWNLGNIGGSFTNYTSSHLLPSFIAFLMTLAVSIVIVISAEQFSNRANLPGKH